MMDCRQNRFCRSLDPVLRERLCENCTRREFKKGAIIYRADIQPYIMLIVDGVMTTQQSFDEHMLVEGDCPAFFINTNGLVLGIENLFNDEPIKRYGYIQYTCLTDGVVARFDRGFIRDFFVTDVELAKAMYKNIVTAAGEACEFAAVLRAPNVEESIRYLLRYAARKGFRLTQQQMADITGHSRVSVTRAISHIKTSDAALWETYQSKGLPRV